MRSLAPENPDGPPLLFVHGAANSSDVWFRWMDSLSALGWATHALDLRGHGNSGPAHDVNLGMVTMADYVADVEEAASRLDAPPVIIGWSMGGLIAQMFEAANRAAPGMILLAPSPPAAVESGRSTDGIDDVYGSEFYGIDPNRKGGGPVLRELGAETAERMVAVSLEARGAGAAAQERRAGGYV